MSVQFSWIRGGRCAGTRQWTVGQSVGFVSGSPPVTPLLAVMNSPMGLSAALFRSASRLLRVQCSRVASPARLVGVVVAVTDMAK
jgi:hypothetical protein